jgi:hypothetical protein
MISNSRLQITLLSSLFKNVNIMKKGNQYMLGFFCLACVAGSLKVTQAIFHYAQQSVFKAIIKQTIHQYLKQTYHFFAPFF